MKRNAILFALALGTVMMIALLQMVTITSANSWTEPPNSWSPDYTYVDIGFPSEGIHTFEGQVIKLYLVSPGDDPATPAIEVTPGSSVEVKAVIEDTSGNPVGASGGSAYMPVIIPVNIYLYLYQGGTLFASSRDVYMLSLLSIPGEAGRELAIPANVASGDYLVVAHSEFDIPDLIRSMMIDNMVGRAPDSPGWMPAIPYSAGATKSWMVRVTGGASTPTPTVTPTTGPVENNSLSMSKEELDSAISSGIPVSISGNGMSGMLSNQHIIMNQSGKTWSIDKFTLNTSDISAPGINSAEANLSVNFDHTPYDGSIKVSILPEPDPNVKTQYVLASIDNNYDIGDIAYVMTVEKTNLQNKVYDPATDEVVDDSGAVVSAVICMKVSPAWVEAHGGNQSVKIMRYDNDTVELLDTKYIGMENGLMVFQAISPHGLSIFALASMDSIVTVVHNDAVQHPPYGIHIPFYLPMLASIVAILALVGQGLLTIILSLGLGVKKRSDLKKQK